MNDAFFIPETMKKAFFYGSDSVWRRGIYAAGGKISDYGRFSHSFWTGLNKNRNDFDFKNRLA